MNSTYMCESTECNQQEVRTTITMMKKNNNALKTHINAAVKANEKSRAHTHALYTLYKKHIHNYIYIYTYKKGLVFPQE